MSTPEAQDQKSKPIISRSTNSSPSSSKSLNNYFGSDHEDEEDIIGYNFFDDESLFDLVGSDYKVRLNHLIERSKNRSSKWRSAIKSHQESLRKRLKEPNLLKTRDKVLFTLFVTNLWITSSMLGLASVQTLSIFYALKLALLYTYRFYSYKKRHWHYFLFDM